MATRSRQGFRTSLFCGLVIAASATTTTAQSLPVSTPEPTNSTRSILVESHHAPTDFADSWCESFNETPEAEQIQRKLTGRYGNPAVVRLLRTLSDKQALQFYLEVSRLIDEQHLHPSPYDARVRQSARNLIEAIKNRDFTRASGMADDPAQIERFRADLLRLAESGPIKGAADAYSALQWTMQVAQRDVGLRQAAVAIEFAYGAIDSLDKYSGIILANDPSAINVLSGNGLVGIGVEIRPDKNRIVIVKTLPHSPAFEKQLKSGDVIESVSGKKLSGSTLEYAVDLLNGPAGSSLTLGVLRDGRHFDVPLVRRHVEVPSVFEIEMLDQNAGYIKLEKFTQRSSKEFDTALSNLERRGMQALIVDLRDNPGGLLTSVVELAEMFLPCGTIVATRGRNNGGLETEYAGRHAARMVPLVVLVDHNSASASEIFAAAIQDNGRGLIVGRRTYGKGTVQTHFPLGNVAGDLRLTTAQFFSPSGRMINNTGVTPDIDVNERVDDFKATYDDSHLAQPRIADRDISEALRAATSRRVIDMAQSASANCRTR